MKQIYVLRHSIPDYATDTLTEEGIQYCAEMKKKLPEVRLVFSSPSGRAQQTAFELTGLSPVIDTRAALPVLTSGQHEVAVKVGAHHKYSYVGALFDIKEVRPVVKAKGQELVNLIKDTFQKLSDGQSAVIITHSWTMAPAKKIICKESFDTPPNDYGFVEGFIVDDSFHVTAF